MIDNLSRPRRAGASSTPKKLTTRQRRGIAALLVEKDNRAAALAAGIAERTLARWLTLPQFQAELQAVEVEAINASLRRLAGVTGLAVDKLKTVIESKTEKTVQQLQAANIALSRYPELRDSQEFAERIRRLEEEFPGEKE